MKTDAQLQRDVMNEWEPTRAPLLSSRYKRPTAPTAPRDALTLRLLDSQGSDRYQTYR